MGNVYDILREIAALTDGIECEEIEPGVFAPIIYPCGSPHVGGEYCPACLKELGSL